MRRSAQPYKYQKYSQKQKGQSTGPAHRVFANFTRFTVIILWDWRKFDHIPKIFDLTLEMFESLPLVMISYF